MAGDSPIPLTSAHVHVVLKESNLLDRAKSIVVLGTFKTCEETADYKVFDSLFATESGMHDHVRHIRTANA